MTETRTAHVVSARDWLAEHIADDAPPVLVNQPRVAAHTEDSSEPVSVDHPAPKETAPPAQASSPWRCASVSNVTGMKLI